MINYREELKYHREKNNLSQNKLAKETGIKQQNINRWEKGEATPNIEFCIKLADFYGISLDELVGRDFNYQNTNTAKYNIGTINNNGNIDMK